MATNNDENNSIAPEEYKKVTEAMYNQNLELARLNKEIEGLNSDLSTANENLRNMIKQRESLVHLVNHKIKGSFTHSKYTFAEMLEGTFGPISPELKKVAELGLVSDNEGIETVNLFLNAANMQNGKIKYEMKPVDFRELVEKKLVEKKIPAEAKGLKLESDIKDGAYNILGDSTWLEEVLNNLIENSIRYTKEGKVMVALEKKPASSEGGDDKIIFSVKDTGVGITDEDKKNLFTEGGRGKESVKINVDSTGYGLYTVKMIVEGHKGRVWAESEGPGKGSQFYVELPAVVE
jgi:signal transduction histidine kinase